jgi:hypothetical protein
MKRHEFAILLATTYLFAYMLLIEAGVTFTAVALVFAISPVPVLWMVYEILRATYNGKELRQEEQWGYQDRAKETLGMF